jgi:hypothetical protein
MRFKAYAIISGALEDGLTYGIRRLFKHEDGPFDEDQLLERKDTLHMALTSALCEVIDFDPEP